MGKINIVITVGGTSEYIDTVRKITNSGSGKLGSMIANVLLKEKNYEIFYIHTPKAKMPEILPNLHPIEVDGTLGLKDAVENILKENKIDWFIHSMAVSDYVVDWVSNSNMLTQWLGQNGINSLSDNKNIYNKGEKISSDSDDLIVRLVTAPKVINIIKQISPATHLVGFKLLTGVSETKLEEVARNLLQKNDCDYVIANDLNNITENQHKAILVGEKEIEERFNSKDEIANGIKQIIQNNNY